jgi:FkbM family methyltransferase
MLLDLYSLQTKYNMNIKGVVHIGAHFGEENTLYNNLNIKNKIFFEPVLSIFNRLVTNVTDGSTLVNKAVGNENKKIWMNIETANEGQSSSILNPKLHLQQYPHIQFTSKEEVDMIRLDDFIQNKEDYNFINADVQGYELEALKGAANLLNNIDYIIAEINRDEVYENCAKIDEMIEFLAPHGFKLVEENWEGGTWGDGFFIKIH